MKQSGFGINVIAYSGMFKAMEIFKTVITSILTAVFTSDSCYKCLCTGQQWETALKLFREIEESGLEPSVITCNSLMSALEKGLQWQRALDLFDDMKFKNMSVTVVSYGSAISAVRNSDFISVTHLNPMHPFRIYFFIV